MVNKGWRHQTHKRASIVFSQMERMLLMAPNEAEKARFLDDASNMYFAKLDELYGEDYQLAKLMDTSDLIFHAEGPAAKYAAPQLQALNWLTSTAEKVLRGIGKGVFDALASSEDTKKLARKLDLRCTGFAPGSLYAGFSLENNSAAMAGMDEGKSEHSTKEIIEVFKHLTVLPNYIGDERLDKGIVELVDDPALRDSLLIWAHKMCPTGRAGIHTLEISDDKNRPAYYSQRERTVLQDAIRRPVVDVKTGSFTGELRSADLDNGRFQLRNVAGLGSLRCVFSGDENELKSLFGKLATLSGKYEVDHQGKPRLFYVDRIEKIYDKQSGQADLLF